MPGIFGDGQRGGIFGAKVDPRLLQMALEQRAEAERQRQGQARIAGAFDASQGMQEPSRALYEAKHRRAQGLPPETSFLQDVASLGPRAWGGAQKMAAAVPMAAGALWNDPLGSINSVGLAGQAATDAIVQGVVRPFAQFGDPNVDPVENAFDLTSVVGAGGLATAGGREGVGVFGGRLAKTANLEKLQRAEAMEAKGLGRSAIWEQTGWTRGPDDKWRFEISDKTSKLSEAARKRIAEGENVFAGGSIPEGEVFSHPDLYAAYPELRGVELSKYGVVPGQGGTAYGNSIGLAPGDAGPMRKTLLHEMQHKVQDIEGFARGGSPLFHRENYPLLAGEVEARNVDRRADWGPQQRSNIPPYHSEDVPREQQIVTHRRGPQASIKAYHGSPHDFERFDASKIGTGEGAQAYGHGLYMAENEGVAKEYRDKLTGLRTSAATRALNSAGGDVDAAIAGVKAEIDRLKSLPNAGNDAAKRDSFISINEEKLAELNALKNSGSMSKGHMYQVDIAADPEHFLDWDKPLSEQSPQVQQAALGTAQPPDPGALRKRAETATGAEKDFLLNQASYLENQLKMHGEGWHGSAVAENLPSEWDDFETARRIARAKVAEQLKERGAAGIRYLDQGSRGAVNVNEMRGTVSMLETAARKHPEDASLQQRLASAKQQLADAEKGQTRNYVVFPGNEHLIAVLKKYGLPISAAGLAALSQLHPQEAQAAQRKPPAASK